MTEHRIKKLRPLADRFWAKVDKRGPDECWEWQGCTGPKGYGQINLGRRGEGIALVSRVSFDLANPDAPLLPHEKACHHCDNPPCVNPRHLFRGSARDNAQDAIRKGRRYGGPRRQHCKQGHELTPENTESFPTAARPGGIDRRCIQCARRRTREWMRDRGRRRREARQRLTA